MGAINIYIVHYVQIYHGLLMSSWHIDLKQAAKHSCVKTQPGLIILVHEHTHYNNEIYVA